MREAGGQDQGVNSGDKGKTRIEKEESVQLNEMGAGEEDGETETVLSVSRGRGGVPHALRAWLGSHTQGGAFLVFWR